MKTVTLLLGIMTIVLMTSCRKAAHPAATSMFTNNPAISPTLEDTPMTTPTKKPDLNPTHTPRPTADPREKYECDFDFCFLDGSDPLAPVRDPSTENGYFIPPPGDTREIITFDETYKVNRGENILIENKIVAIEPKRRGDIEIYGTLTIRDSFLTWKQTEHQQTRFRVKSGGVLVIENSYCFSANQYWLNWDFEDGSTIIFNHFVNGIWTTINGSVNYTSTNYSSVGLTIFGNTHDTKVQILNAHHLWFEIYPPKGTHRITFPEKRQWADWSIPDFWPNTTVEVKDSYISERDISLGNNTHVTIQNVPSGFSLGWSISKESPGFVDCELRNLGEPGNDQGVFYEDMTWDLPCNNSSLTVRNSLLQVAWPVTSGYVHLKVFDSNLADTRNYGAPATMEIYNSTIGIVATYNGGRVYVENSPIKESIEVKDAPSVIYGFGVTGGYELLETDGGKYIQLDEPGPPWE